MNFIPTSLQESWIKSKVESGDYANASEVLRDAIREKMERDRIREAKLRDLRTAIDEGEASGDPIPLDIEKIIARGEQRRAERNQTRPPE
ncbi:MAG: type II toxin-antitoxin system ParD family antitoxin [Chloroflexota bacterium]